MLTKSKLIKTQLKKISFEVGEPISPNKKKYS